MNILFVLLRFVFNMLAATAFIWLSYTISQQLALNFLTSFNDEMILGLAKQYDYIVGAIGVVASLVIIGFVVILHDIGEWITDWFIRPFQRHDQDE